MKLVFLSLVIIVVTKCVSSENKKVVCYHGTWSTYRPGDGKFDVTDIDPTLCTHLIYTFFGIKGNGEFRILDAYLDLEENWGRGNIRKFNDLKQLNPNLKTLAAVGGWNEGSRKFSETAKDPAKRERFIKSAVAFILKHGFDGLDMDWEYPAQRDGDQNVDKENFVIFLRELKQELTQHNLILTAAVSSAEFSASLSYNVKEISKYLDFISVMAYDLHGAWDEKIGVNAPLYAGSADVSDKEKQLNVNASISYWLNEGAPANKIILGLPFYGRTFTLSDPQQTSIGSRRSGKGQAGKYTRELGFIGYNELCEQFKDKDWIIEWEPKQMVPYAYKGNQWVGYDNEKSVELKVRYANEMKLGGIMLWSIETDDFRGTCGEKYPLLKKIVKVLGNRAFSKSSIRTTTTSIVSTKQSIVSSNLPTISSTLLPSTVLPKKKVEAPPKLKCKPDDKRSNRDSQDCSKFYICNLGQRTEFQCPTPLLFDLKILSCNYPEKVNCKKN